MQKIATIIDKNIICVHDHTQFDPYAIMHSGQVFRYFEIDGGYRLVVGRHFADILAADKNIIIKCSDADFFYNYFDFDTDYGEIKKTLAHFDGLAPAISAGIGIRILRAEFVETVLSFIISANNNIKRFTKTLNLLAQRCGDKLPNGYYAFPTVTQLGSMTESDFKAIGCGYRSAYLVKAVAQLAALNAEMLGSLDNSGLSKTLRQIHGVGQKVADCVMLFAFHRLDICPVDVHIKRALEQLGKEKADDILNHKYAGVAQQYIFYYMQHLKKGL